MEAEAIEKIVELAAPQLDVINSLQYSSKPLHLVAPPQIANLRITSLSGLVALVKSGFEQVRSESHMVHVDGPSAVHVTPFISTTYAQRTVAVTAAVMKEDRTYRFNEYLSQEEAMIGLQACFVRSASDPPDDLSYVLKLVADIATEDRLQVQDNGITQTVTAKGGVTLVNTVPVQPRVRLTPFRTFREVEQPPSDFLLRIKKGGDGFPKVGLFEADGGAWKLQAVTNTASWLGAELPDWTVVY